MRLFSSVVTIFALIVIAPVARPADDPLSWPHFRGNREHNGRSLGTGAIVNPAVQTSQKLGGSTTPTKMRFDDFVFGPNPDLLIVESGRLYLKTTSDQIIWHTESLGITDIIGIHDLDQNGSDEVIVTIPGPDAQLAIFSIAEGELLWLYDQFGLGSSIFLPHDPVIADLNGDGFLELLCSARMNDDVSHAFSFASGFLANSADNLLWEAPQKSYGQIIPYLVGDVDGDQLSEVVYLEAARLNILAGASGAEQLHQTDVFMTYSFGPTALANVDADSELEILAIGTEWYNLALTVFDASDGAEGILWQYQWYPTSGKRLRGTGRSIIDVDGDGALEIVVGIYNNGSDEITTNGSVPGEYDGVDEPNRWVTAIYDARSGALEHYLVDRQYLGIAPTTAEAPPSILTRETATGEINPPKFGTIRTYRFENDVYASVHSILRAQPLMETAEKSARATSSEVLLSHDLNDNGRREIFVAIDGDMNGDADTVEALDIAGSSVIRRSWMPLDDWYEYTPITTWHPINENARLVWKLNNGQLHQLNENLSVVKRTELGEFGPTAISADLDSANGNEILTTHSTGRFVAYQWQPKALQSEWELQTSQQGPMLAFDREGDGVNELAVAEYIDRESPKLILLDDGGLPLWQRTFGDYGTPVTLISTGNFDGDPTTDLVVSITDSRLANHEDLRVVALSGANGSILWNQPLPLNRHIAGTLHIADLTADGIDDVTVVDTYEITSYDGVDGTIVSQVPYNGWSYTHFGADMDGDDVNELVLMNFNADPGTELFEFGQPNNSWNIPHNYDFELNYSWASVYAAADGLGLIRATPSGSITAFDPAGQPVWGPVWTRKGALLSADPGGANDVRYLSVADIDGNGIENAIFATEDGHLLAVDTTDGSLTWSLPLYGPAREAILSDVDGDNLLEIIVSGRDGYIHVVDDQTLDRPQNVQDLSSTPLSTTSHAATASPAPTDIDTTAVRTALSARWDPVEGADGYLMSALDAAGVLLQPWTDVGNVTSATIQTAPLPLNAVYHVVVKAYALDGGQSNDGASDGILIQDDQAPIASVIVDPPVFNPQSTDALVSLSLSDSTWISHYELTIESQGYLLVTELAQDIYGVAFAEEITWPGDHLAAEELGDGDYIVRITATDDAENTATYETTLTIDTVAPPAPTCNVRVDADNQPKYSGATESEAHVTVTVDGMPACFATANLTGLWQCTGLPLLAGEHTALAVADDLAANRSAPSEPAIFQLIDAPLMTPAEDSATDTAQIQGVPYDCTCHAAGARGSQTPFSLLTGLLKLWM